MNRSLRLALRLALATGCLWSPRAHANAASLLGYGARDSALAASDVADADPAAAATVNPAFAWRPGVRLLAGYGYGSMRLRISGRDAGVRDVSGTDLALQIGSALDHAGKVALGGGLTLHIPDAYQARVFFRAPTEPSFPLYDSPPQRTVFDVALAFRYHALSLGVGASVLAGTSGRGADFILAQDANGTFADSRTDIALPIAAAPTAGLALELGRLAIAGRLRAPLSLGVAVETEAYLAVHGNPFNGHTDVDAFGESAYEPLTLDLGARADLTPALRVFADVTYTRWSAAPPPSATITLDLDLVTTPSELEARFTAPRFRDTLSPHLGLELRVLELPRGALEPRRRAPISDDERGPPRLALRAGWTVSPSPVPRQTGLTSYADSTRNVFALGAGYCFGRAWGIELTSDVALAYHRLARRDFDKGSDVLPNAHYRASGDIYAAALTFGAAWR